MARILIIDDEHDLRENLKYVLKMKGFEIDTAEDGVEGLKKLETFTPDLIILDLNMPNMGGIEFYQRICERDTPKYPVFVLTARANMEQFFKDFNVDGFMAKPFDISELLQEVQTVVDKRAGKAGEAQAGTGPKKVFIVEDDAAFSSKAGAALLLKGHTVNLAKSGAEALERMSRDVPDAALVKMNLKDIPGEIVIAKLKRMAKTSTIQAVLYTSAIADREVVTEKIRHKGGIDKFTVYNSEHDLVAAIDGL